jgi:hypothetical protein
MILDDGGRRFESLRASEQRRFRHWGLEMVRWAASHAVPVIFGPPPGVEGVINGASGLILRIANCSFFVTAAHVLDEYERRLGFEKSLLWQIGRLPPIDPLSRRVRRNHESDIVLVPLSDDEANRVGSAIATIQAGQSPPTPKEDGLVLVAGFPKTLREVIPSGQIEADGLSAMFRITDVRDHTFDCRIGNEEDLVSFNGSSLPNADMDMGGLSGGPAFLIVGGPIEHIVPIGIISEYISKSFDGLRLLRITKLRDAAF